MVTVDFSPNDATANQAWPDYCGSNALTNGSFISTSAPLFAPKTPPDERPKHDPFFAKAMWKKPRQAKRPFRHIRHNPVPGRVRMANGRRGRRT